MSYSGLNYIGDEINTLIIINQLYFPGRLLRNNVKKNTFSIDF